MKIFLSFKEMINKIFIQIPVFRKNKDDEVTLRTVVNVTRMKYVLIAQTLCGPVLTLIWFRVTADPVTITLEPNTIATIFRVCPLFLSSPFYFSF